MATSPNRTMNLVTVALCAFAAFVFVPLWTPLVLAVWFAALLRPALLRLTRWLGGSKRAAGTLVVLVVVVVLLPLGFLALAIVSPTQELLGQVRAAMEGQGTLRNALLGGEPGATPPVGRNWADLASRYGANAWGALSLVARASAGAVIAALVFVAALYTCLVDGERGYAWLEARVPITRQEFARLAGAFRETGRGLIVAGGGTALVQGVVATVAYACIGIPRALILGPLTAVCALVPLVGTALVWIPLSIELFSSGHYGRAVSVLVTGGVVSVIDNVARPMWARSGHLKLPAFVVLVSMIGGVAAFGATGALLGPLVVRMCVEALAIVSERRETELASRSQS